MLCRHVEVDVSTHGGPSRWRPENATTMTKGIPMAKKKATAKTQNTKKKARKSASKTASKKSATKSGKSTPSKKAKRTGVLDAAVKVLAGGKSMSCGEIVEVALKRKLWKTQGKTPAATLNAAIHREIKSKGKDARFAKAERGTFTVKK